MILPKKSKDTAHRINGVGRPVGSALESDISNNSISENPSTVNNNSTTHRTIPCLFGNEPLLVNKQMIKTGIDDIPNLKGLKEEIKQKQSETEFLTDLKKVHEIYAQSVNQSHSSISITENPHTVNNNSMRESANNSKNKLQFSFVKVQDDSLIEEAERMEKQLQNMNYSSDKIRSESCSAF